MQRSKHFVTAAVLVVVSALLIVGGSARVAAQDVEQIKAAKRQAEQIILPLNDSEAERAMGSYVPGAGAFFTMDLLRGPNAVTDRAPYYAVRDWMIYLMTTFGGQLEAVPADETIGMTVNYYDFETNSYHQMVMSSRKGDVADPAKFTIWLDGRPFSEAAAELDAARAPATQEPATAEPTVAPVEPTEPPTAVPDATSPAAQATAQPSGDALAPDNADTASVQPTARPAGPVNVVTGFEAVESAADWSIASGKWSWASGAYQQTELGKFDLVTYYNQPIEGGYRITADVRLIEGEMGAGLIFNGLDLRTKKGAQMVSFAGNGSFLQWGYFDLDGIFQYQGGIPIAKPTSDGAWHTLTVDVVGQTYQVSLDGVVLGSNLTAQRAAGGFAGLLASTSHVEFDNVRIESIPA